MSLQLDRLFNPLLRGFEACGDDSFVHLWCAVGVEVKRLLRATCFDHHDCYITVVKFASGNDKFKCAGFAFFERGVGNPRALLGVRHAHCTNWPIKWDAADHERCRRCIDCQYVVRVDLVSANYGDHDLGFVAETVGECRTQRAVDQTAGQNGLLTWTTFTTEERARDFPCGVCTLFNVDGQRKEVDAVTHALCGVGGDEHGRFSDGCYDSAL